jgi:hypothetical protein
MTREDIIRMAREAGFPDYAMGLASEDTWQKTERFAALVAAAKPEPATEKQVTEAYMTKGSEDWWSDYQAGWREAERFYGIRGSKT